LTAYKTEFEIIDQLIVDAESKEEAYEIAAKEAADIYDVEDFQVNVRFAEELN
jgi:hypothetical protein